jgi:hypothetical protein
MGLSAHLILYAVVSISYDSMSCVLLRFKLAFGFETGFTPRIYTSFRIQEVGTQEALLRSDGHMR